MKRRDETPPVLLFLGLEDETMQPFLESVREVYQVKVLQDAAEFCPETAGAYRADLVLMHHEDGGGTGLLERVQQIRSVNHFLDIPILVVTARGDGVDYTALFESGIRDVIEKPVIIPPAMARLRTHLELLFFRRLLQEETNLDAVTGVMNRHTLDDHLRREWSRARRNRKPVSLVFICLDYFESFGALYGRQPMADCLRLVAAGLQTIVKRPADFVARYEENTFVTLLPETDAEAACQIAEALRRKIEALEIDNRNAKTGTGTITATLGVATGIPREDGGDARKLVQLGRQALAEAQSLGSNCIASFIMPKDHAETDSEP
ncbi:GGDEF domain-containing protein [Acanthopleuribacter pedis]|uniref:diguanylate cyclase n=1 Tax=Acanthopleuribacter pedis TaxID=442870 RepID=A0A8J7U0U5_9BACT|nr:diguanylate cyclase [Acanthopleuribacter pedis]MBO1317448.1 diguanylate cyclase [Acanthopleuribacter pedis]